jgi:hypothetical protein
MVNLAGEIFRKSPQFPFRYHLTQALRDPRDMWHFAGRAVLLPGRRCYDFCLSG